MPCICKSIRQYSPPLFFFLFGIIKPFELDYTIVFTTLSEIIAEAYIKFEKQESFSLVSIFDHDHFHKIETRLKVKQLHVEHVQKKGAFGGNFFFSLTLFYFHSVLETIPGGI